MSLTKKLLKTTPIGYAAVKASERKNDPEHQAAKTEKKAQRAAAIEKHGGVLAAAKAEKLARRGIDVDARGAEVAKLKVAVPIGKNSSLPGVALRLYEDGSIEQKKRLGSVIGATASVEQTSKSKATWTMGTGLLGGKKIAGHVFLTITGPDINVVQELHEMCAAKARVFAGEVNRLAAQLTPAMADPAPIASTSDELAKLASLHESGALTADEFSAAKAALLA